MLLVSDDFLWRHSYLKDSSALIRESNRQSSKSEGQANGNISEICHIGMFYPRFDELLLILDIVWDLRGWSDSKEGSGKKGQSLYKDKSNRSFELKRSDAKDIPKWKEVEHRQDGKHRLGYNPAKKTKEISQEDFEAVRADGKKKGKGDAPRFERKGGDRAALAKL